MVSEYVPSYAHKIEATSDTILANCQDPVIRKMHCSGRSMESLQAFGAASRPDPLASYCDLWVLTRQMLYLFESAGEQPRFGPWQEDVIVACRELDCTACRNQSQTRSEFELRRVRSWKKNGRSGIRWKIFTSTAHRSRLKY